MQLYEKDIKYRLDVERGGERQARRVMFGIRKVMLHERPIESAAGKIIKGLVLVTL